MTFVREIIIPAMEKRGRMPNKAIYAAVKTEAKKRHWPLTRHWRATVRNTLQRHSKQSTKFVGRYFFKHHRKNLWECRAVFYFLREESGG